MKWTVISIDLYHYYDWVTGPFVSVSELSIEEANAVLRQIQAAKPNSMCAKRTLDYMENRRRFEEMLKAEFAKKGGRIERNTPHYMVVEHSPWLSTWYENSRFLRIPMDAFDLRTVSFTYGDSHPVFSPRANLMDGKEYRKTLYTYHEIVDIIQKYGLPQDWNNDGKYGPERYIEAHIWSDGVIGAYRHSLPGEIE